MARNPLIVVTLAAVCSSCVPNRMYRSSDCSHPDDLARRGLTCSALREQLRTGEFDRVDVALNPGNDALSWPYRLAFIEFGDNGEMFDPHEVDRALEEIAAAKTDARSLSGKAVVALFVHGWKNNASDDSGNVWGFRQVLAGLSRQFAKDSSSAGGKVPVVGIYVGWRGAVVNAPIIEEFTYWDRRQKSQKLPNAHMVEALLKLMQAAKGANYDDPQTVSVMVGHSFGGAVLETALAQTLKDTVVNGPGHRIKSPANLIVLLNEAQEALRSYPLIESLIENGDTQDHCSPRDVGGDKVFENPTIVSISSTGDYATRAFYPFGQAFVRPFTHLQTFPQPDSLGFTSESPMFFNTTAHSTNFQSHLLEAIAEPAAGTTDQVAERVDPEMKQALTACTPFLDLTLSGIHYLMVEKPGSNNHTPYWVMQMPTTIVPDHSTIFTPVFRNFLIALLIAVTL
jgi:hypothetical protein